MWIKWWGGLSWSWLNRASSRCTLTALRGVYLGTLFVCVEHPCGDAAEAITATERGGSWHVSASDLFPKKDLCRKIDLKMSKGHRQQRAGGGGGGVGGNWKQKQSPSFFYSVVRCRRSRVLLSWIPSSIYLRIWNCNSKYLTETDDLSVNLCNSSFTLWVINLKTRCNTHVLSPDCNTLDICSCSEARTSISTKPIAP